MRTVKIRHRRVVLVLDEHVAELNLATVHVLTSHQQLRSVTPLGEPLRQNVSHLSGQAGLQVGEVRLHDIHDLVSEHAQMNFANVCVPSTD